MTKIKNHSRSFATKPPRRPLPTPRNSVVRPVLHSVHKNYRGSCEFFSEDILLDNLACVTGVRFKNPTSRKTLSGSNRRSANEARGRPLAAKRAQEEEEAKSILVDLALNSRADYNSIMEDPSTYLKRGRLLARKKLIATSKDLRIGKVSTAKGMKSKTTGILSLLGQKSPKPGGEVLACSLMTNLSLNDQRPRPTRGLATCQNPKAIDSKYPPISKVTSAQLKMKYPKGGLSSFFTKLSSDDSDDFGVETMGRALKSAYSTAGRSVIQRRARQLVTAKAKPSLATNRQTLARKKTKLRGLSKVSQESLLLLSSERDNDDVVIAATSKEDFFADENAHSEWGLLSLKAKSAEKMSKEPSQTRTSSQQPTDRRNGQNTFLRHKNPLQLNESRCQSLVHENQLILSSHNVLSQLGKKRSEPQVVVDGQSSSSSNAGSCQLDGNNKPQVHHDNDSLNSAGCLFSLFQHGRENLDKSSTIKRKIGTSTLVIDTALIPNPTAVMANPPQNDDTAMCPQRTMLETNSQVGSVEKGGTHHFLPVKYRRDDLAEDTSREKSLLARNSEKCSTQRRSLPVVFITEEVASDLSLGSSDLPPAPLIHASKRSMLTSPALKTECKRHDIKETPRKVIGSYLDLTSQCQTDATTIHSNCFETDKLIESLPRDTDDAPAVDNKTSSSISEQSSSESYRSEPLLKPCSPFRSGIDDAGADDFEKSNMLCANQIASTQTDINRLFDLREAADDYVKLDKVCQPRSFASPARKAIDLLDDSLSMAYGAYTNLASSNTQPRRNYKTSGKWNASAENPSIRRSQRERKITNRLTVAAHTTSHYCTSDTKNSEPASRISQGRRNATDRHVDKAGGSVSNTVTALLSPTGTMACPSEQETVVRTPRPGFKVDKLVVWSVERCSIKRGQLPAVGRSREDPNQSRRDVCPAQSRSTRVIINLPDDFMSPDCEDNDAMSFSSEQPEHSCDRSEHWKSANSHARHALRDGKPIDQFTISARTNAKQPASTEEESRRRGMINHDGNQAEKKNSHIDTALPPMSTITMMPPLNEIADHLSLPVLEYKSVVRSVERCKTQQGRLPVIYRNKYFTDDATVDGQVNKGCDGDFPVVVPMPLSVSHRPCRDRKKTDFFHNMLKGQGWVRRLSGTSSQSDRSDASDSSLDQHSRPMTRFQNQADYNADVKSCDEKFPYIAPPTLPAPDLEPRRLRVVKQRKPPFSKRSIVKGGEVDGWTSIQLEQLRNAYAQADPTSATFWLEVAALVEYKTASECRSHWFSSAKTPAPKLSKRNVAMKEDKQLLDNEDDIFNSTPMRGCLIPRINGISMMSDSALPMPTGIAGTTIELKATDEAGPFDRPKFVYKSYLQRMKRDSARVQKEIQGQKKKNVLNILEKSTRTLSDAVHDHDVNIKVRLSPGGTLKVQSQADDDFWNEMYDAEDEEEVDYDW